VWCFSMFRWLVKDRRYVKLLTNSFHVVLGTVTPLMMLLTDKYLRAVGLLLLSTYLVYQVLTSKSKEELEEDVLEFVLGNTIALITYLIIIVK